MRRASLGAAEGSPADAPAFVFGAEIPHRMKAGQLSQHHRCISDT
jgi:hypothetical protein